MSKKCIIVVILNILKLLLKLIKVHWNNSNLNIQYFIMILLKQIKKHFNILLYDNNFFFFI